MKVELLCHPCMMGGAAEGRSSFITFIPTVVQDRGIYDVTCPLGHRTVCVVPGERFERLFVSSASALFDGYAREAVASVAAAVERFYEFCIEVFLEQADVDGAQRALAWKAVRRTERELGAFVFLFTVATGTCPPLLSTKWTEFRNNVIHKGEFPTVEKATDYGDACLAHVFSVIKAIDGTHSRAIDNVMMRHQKELLDAAENFRAGVQPVVSSSTRDNPLRLLSRTDQYFGTLTFRSWLKHIEDVRNLTLKTTPLQGPADVSA